MVLSFLLYGLIQSQLTGDFTNLNLVPLAHTGLPNTEFPGIPTTGACLNGALCFICPVPQAFNVNQPALTFNCGTKGIITASIVSGKATFCGVDDGTDLCLGLTGATEQLAWVPSSRSQSTIFDVQVVPRLVTGKIQSNGELDVNIDNVVVLRIAGKCAQILGPDSPIYLSECTGQSNQQFMLLTESGGTINFAASVSTVVSSTTATKAVLPTSVPATVSRPTSNPEFTTISGTDVDNTEKTSAQVAIGFSANLLAIATMILVRVALAI